LISRRHARQISDMTNTTVWNDIIIRAATPSDAATLNRYIRHIYREGTGMITRPEEFRASNIRQRFWLARKGINPDETCLLALHGDAIVGMLECWTDRRRRVRHSTTITMSVHANWRKRGIGKKLLLHFTDWVHKHPRLERVELHVHADNEAALALYRSIGFAHEGTRRNVVRYEDGVVVDDHIMAFWPKHDKMAPENGA
jgi:ribosomal protein S18 acetylase RimI-like enzyme